MRVNFVAGGSCEGNWPKPPSGVAINFDKIMTATLATAREAVGAVVYRDEHERLICAVCDALGEAAFNALWTEGRALSAIARGSRACAEGNTFVELTIPGKAYLRSGTMY